MPPAVVAVIAAAVWLQHTTPFKKSDLIRLLSTSLAPQEIADLVQRRCVSFIPSARDKEDLRALGADELLLRRLDECARKLAPLGATARLREAIVTAGGRASVMVDVRRGDVPVPAVRVVLRGSGRLTGGLDAELVTDAAGRAVFEIPVGSAAGTFPLSVVHPDGSSFTGAGPMLLTVRPAPLTVAPARTGFVSGTGQRGRVGTRLALPLVFEVRDTANRPVPARALTLSGFQARVEPTQAVTDSNGRVVAFVTLGQRAGPAHVVARLGQIERQAPLMALPGPPASVALRCGTTEVSDRLVLGVGMDHDVSVVVRDAFGNDLPVSDIRATARDPRTVRPSVTVNAVVLRGLRGGETSLVVEAAGVRRSIAAVVGPADGAPTACRRGVPGG